VVLDGQRIAVLIPAYNEGSQIRRVLESVPAYVDHMVVVDDASTDDTVVAVEGVVDADDRIELIQLTRATRPDS